jgi:serine/threonine-protein kinase
LLNLDAHLEVATTQAGGERAAATAAAAAAAALREQAAGAATTGVAAPSVAADGGLARAATKAASLQTSPTVAAQAASRAPLGRIGPYELTAALAHDGLGSLFKAWDTSERIEVMVTLLDLEADARDREVIVERLQKSVLAAAALKFPGLARIHDAGVVGEGVYIVNEWLPGRSLSLAQASGWQPTARVAAVLVRDLARALAHAHGRGVLHGGLNPSTVMLDASDRPTLLGLGYACIAHASDLPSMDPLLRGAAPYLAPEQLQGGIVDARTDVHALGVLLYELLTGRRAYPGATAPEVARALMAHDPAPPHWLRLDVPERLSAIAMQALQRNPAARYSQVSEVVDALNAWLEQSEDDLDEARDAFLAAQQPAKPVRRTGYWMSGSVLAAATAVVAFTWVDRHPPAPVPAPLPAFEGVASGEPEDDAQASVSVAAGPSQTPPPPLAVAAGAGPAAGPLHLATDAPLSAGPAGLPGNAAAPETVVPPRAAPQTPTGPGTAAEKDRPAPRTPPRDSTRSAAAETRAAAAPAALPVGTVQLAVSPWGYVEVGGKLAGASPPLQRLMLPEGTHTITIRNEDFAPFVTTVQVTADKAATVRHRFPP